MARMISRIFRVFLKLTTSSSETPVVKIPSFSLTSSVSFLIRSCHSVTDLVLDRMPPQIGNFIAQTVYPSVDDSEDAEPLLKSNELHPLADASDKSLLCYFVDVPGQQVSQGTSWKVSTLFIMDLFQIDPSLIQNFEECKAIVQLATIFQVQEKNYRIITPYDAQRSLIEEELKKAELEWGDRCFNVDSFQGKFHVIF